VCRWLYAGVHVYPNEGVQNDKGLPQPPYGQETLLSHVCVPVRCATCLLRGGGEVILLTAQERREGGVFQPNPVTMIVAWQHGKWVSRPIRKKPSSHCAVAVAIFSG